jgi:hypothetical protein
MNGSRNQAETEVVDTLTGNSGTHVVEIADSIDRHPVLVERVCIRLCEREVLVSNRRGFYELTDGSTQHSECR